MSSPSTTISPSPSLTLRNAKEMLFEPDIQIRQMLNGGGCGLKRVSCNLMKSYCKTTTPTTCIARQSPATIITSCPQKLSTNNTTMNNIFNCTLCCFVCTWKYDLKLHLKQKHGIIKKL